MHVTPLSPIPRTKLEENANIETKLNAINMFIFEVSLRKKQLQTSFSVITACNSIIIKEHNPSKRDYGENATSILQM
jgi:hypothetical protein